MGLQLPGEGSSGCDSIDPEMQTAILKFFSHGDPRLTRLGYFVAAVLLHLVLFVLLATYVIFNAPATPPDASFLKISIAKPPPPIPTPPAQAAGGMAANALEPDVTVTPPPVAPSIITSVASTFSVSSVSVKLPNLASLSDHASGTAVAGQGSSGSGAGNGSPFGSAIGSGSALFQGYLYDLKQTVDRKPTGMVSDQYRTILLKMLTSGWDPSLLAPFYRSPKPIYTSQILVPDMDANEGPKAFDAQGTVEPKLWVVWYKARLSPPTSGVYRFAGFADDELLVRVDGQNVLDGSIVGISPSLIRHTPWPNDWSRTGCRIKITASFAKEFRSILRRAWRSI